MRRTLIAPWYYLQRSTWCTRCERGMWEHMVQYFNTFLCCYVYRYKKSPSECSKGLCGIGRRPTLPPVRAVPSARPGLTSLFGMGRGVPRRCNHRNLSARLLPRMGLTYSWKKKSPQPHSLRTFPALLFPSHRESFGQLVPLGFDIAAFTPAAYRRRRLQRPSNEASS